MGEPERVKQELRGFLSSTHPIFEHLLNEEIIDVVQEGCKRGRKFCIKVNWDKLNELLPEEYDSLLRIRSGITRFLRKWEGEHPILIAARSNAVLPVPGIKTDSLERLNVFSERLSRLINAKYHQPLLNKLLDLGFIDIDNEGRVQKTKLFKELKNLLSREVIARTSGGKLVRLIEKISGMPAHIAEYYLQKRLSSDNPDLHLEVLAKDLWMVATLRKSRYFPEEEEEPGNDIEILPKVVRIRFGTSSAEEEALQLLELLGNLIEEGKLPKEVVWNVIVSPDQKEAVEKIMNLVKDYTVQRERFAGRYHLRIALQTIRKYLLGEDDEHDILEREYKDLFSYSHKKNPEKLPIVIEFDGERYQARINPAHPLIQQFLD